MAKSCAGSSPALGTIFRKGYSQQVVALSFFAFVKGCSRGKNTLWPANGPKGGPKPIASGWRIGKEMPSWPRHAVPPQPTPEFSPYAHSVHLPRGSHLYRKGNIFYFRQVLSGALRERFSRTEIRLSLKTAYLQEANNRAAHLHCLFSAAVEVMPMLSQLHG